MAKVWCGVCIRLGKEGKGEEGKRGKGGKKAGACRLHKKAILSKGNIRKKTVACSLQKDCISQGQH